MSKHSLENLNGKPDFAAGSAPSAPGFCAWAFLVNLAFLAAFAVKAVPATMRAWAFAAAVVLSYAFLYALPVVLGALAVRPLLRRGRAAARCGGALLAALATVVQLWLAADYVIHGMFGYHINGFVLNLVMTPEGVESMGADAGMRWTAGLVALAVLAVNVLAWFALSRGRAVSLAKAWLGGRTLKIALASLLALALAERFTYGVGNLLAWSDVVAVAQATPGYQPATFRSLAGRLGFEGRRQVSVAAPRQGAAFSYPAKALTLEEPARRPNIVWLVCESLRADMLTPEIMPRTWAFAQENTRFTRHYSGGNGTRMAVFTLFYGMPGSYWFPALAARRGPVFVDRLQELGYELRCSTSAAFSYPEFDKTVFVRVPAEQLHPKNLGEGWKSDRHHTALIKEWLEGRAGDAKPFFLFHFFESSHARYYFPPESVIRRPYLEAFNYATADIRRDIGLIFNRYVNAVHHLDSQLGAVLDALREKGLLEDTVVVITGDHGEEFYEAGRWGHNSAFTEPQVRVPLVVRIPGREPSVIEYPTSHADMAPTLLPLLGATGPASDYSTGENLFSAAPRLLTFADWDRIAISDGDHKCVFPLRASTQVMAKVTTADDRPVDDDAAVVREQGANLVRLMSMLNRFAKKQ